VSPTQGLTTNFVIHESMTASEFQMWLDTMGITAVEAGHLMDVHPNTISKYKREGCPKIVALACLALYHRLDRLT